MFKAGDKAATKAVQAPLASGEPFADPSSVATYPSNPAFFGIKHYHRGQIVALQRQDGYSQTQLDQLEEHWGIWRA
jgi:uncharacterized damage-inducible protein DinB